MAKKKEELIFSLDEDGHSLHLRMASSGKLLKKAVNECKKRMALLCGFDAAFGAPTVIQELLKNAIEHGNGNDTGKMIRADITYIPDGCFEIWVEDEGQGFDYTEVNSIKRDDISRKNQRGYLLIHTLSDQVSFNEKGNGVKAVVSRFSLSKQARLVP